MEMGGNAILAYAQWIDIEPYSQTITLRGLGTAAIMKQPERDSSNSDTSSIESAPLPFSDTEIPLKLYSRGIELATLSKVPAGCIAGIGGIVSAKSVKLMSEETDYGSAETRDRWLCELRDEVRSHARNLGCNLVLGYRESISTHDDLYILAAEGTACRMRRRETKRRTIMLTEGSSADEAVVPDEAPITKTSPLVARNVRPIRRLKDCASCHLPRGRSIFKSGDNGELCNICRKSIVADMILSTIDVSPDVETFGDQLLVESYICRPLKKKKDGESVATTVSSNLPFIEYELYRQLQFKLRYHGFNSVFGLRYQVVASDTMIVAIASGTGICLAALPEPQPLQISRNIEIRDAEDEQIYNFQERAAHSSSEKHARIHDLYADRFPSAFESSSGTESTSSSSSSSSSSSDGSLSEEDRQSVVQIDDDADEDLLLTLVEPNIDTLVMAGTLDTQPLIDSHWSPKSSLHPASQFICQFRRFTVNREAHHPNSSLASQFSRHYEEIIAQLEGQFSDLPRIHCVRHQLNLVRSVELQIVTTATVFGTVKLPVASSKDLLEPVNFEWDQNDIVSSDSEEEDVTRRHGPDAPAPISPPSNIVFSTGSTIPSSVFVDNCGTITIQLFKEMYYSESTGGFAGFVGATISDVFAVTRAAAASLGGNAVTSIAFKPAAFYENFKNQLHAVVTLTADVIEVEHDREDIWPLLQSI